MSWLSSVSSRSISSQPHARVALGQAVRAEQHRRAGDLGRGDLAGAGAEEAQHVLLQPRRLLGRDLAVRAVPEPGRDAVDRDLAGDQVVLERARGLHAPHGLRRERGAAAVAGEPHGLVDRQRPTVEVEVHSDIGLKQIRHDEAKVLALYGPCSKVGNSAQSCAGAKVCHCATCIVLLTGVTRVSKIPGRGERVEGGQRLLRPAHWPRRPRLRWSRRRSVTRALRRPATR